MITRKSIGLLALLAALGALAVSAASAWATEFLPAGDEYEATSGLTKFIGNNGAGAPIECEVTEATGQVPPVATAYEFNTLAGGSVNGPITSLTFEECIAGGVFPATVIADADTISVSGEFADANGNHPVAVNVPPDGATISIPELGCTLTLPDDRTTGVAASVMGAFENAAVSGEPSMLYAEGQLPFEEAGCGALGLESQGVFFANGAAGTEPLSVVDTTNAGASIKVN